MKINQEFGQKLLQILFMAEFHILLYHNKSLEYPSYPWMPGFAALG